MFHQNHHLFFINRITRCSTHQVFQHFQLAQKIAAMTTLNERKKFEASFFSFKIACMFSPLFPKNLKSICGEKCCCFFKSYNCSWHDIAIFFWGLLQLLHFIEHYKLLIKNNYSPMNEHNVWQKSVQNIYFAWLKVVHFLCYKTSNFHWWVIAIILSGEGEGDDCGVLFSIMCMQSITCVIAF